MSKTHATFYRQCQVVWRTDTAWHASHLQAISGRLEGRHCMASNSPTVNFRPPRGQTLLAMQLTYKQYQTVHRADTAWHATHLQAIPDRLEGRHCLPCNSPTGNTRPSRGQTLPGIQLHLQTIPGRLDSRHGLHGMQLGVCRSTRKTNRVNQWANATCMMTIISPCDIAVNYINGV